jgi:hypothetical protein
MFVKRVQQYKILADEDKKLYKKGIFSILEPLKHRDLKIRQLRMETELRDQIKVGYYVGWGESTILDSAGGLIGLFINRLTSFQAIRDYRDPASASKSLDNDLSLVASLIADRSGGESIYNNPSSANVKAVRDDEELLRQMTLLAIRLCWMKAHGAISLLEAERDLLKKAPPDEGEGEELAREKDEKERQRQRQLQRDKDMSWRLDPTRRGGGPDGRGPLLDPRGRVRLWYGRFCISTELTSPGVHSPSDLSRSRLPRLRIECAYSRRCIRLITVSPRCRSKTTLRRRGVGEISLAAEGEFCSLDRDRSSPLTHCDLFVSSVPRLGRVRHLTNCYNCALRKTGRWTRPRRRLSKCARLSTGRSTGRTIDEGRVIP